jgi:hypothetical protein
VKAFGQRTAPPWRHGQLPDLSHPPCGFAWLITLAATAAPTYALAEARRATTLADGTEMHTFQADAHRDLADVAWRAGDHDVALSAAAFALRLYDAKENVVAAAQLRHAMTSLAR